MIDEATVHGPRSKRETPVQLSLQRLFWAILVAAIVLAAVRFGAIQYHQAVARYEAFGAVWQTHDMLMEHMYRTDGEWPSDWDDLEPMFSTTNRGYGAPNFDWLRQRVRVDFSFDSRTCHHETKKRLIALPDGESNGDTRDATRRILNYILERYPKSSKQ